MFGGGEAPRVFCNERARLRAQIFGKIRSRSSGKCCSLTGPVRAWCAGQLLSGKPWRAHAAFDMDSPPGEVISFGLNVNAAGHHDAAAASVLGTVQGAALRSARACARPSGLDGACAQMIDGQLRDGHRMLFPSGTNGASIDPSDGREKR
jgi:hypothetical protein